MSSYTDLQYIFGPLSSLEKKQVLRLLIKSILEVKEYEKNKRKIFNAQNHNMYHVIDILLCVFPTISILSYYSQGTIEVSWEMQFSLFQLYLLNCLIEPEKISASFSTRTSVKFLFQKIWSP